MKGYVGSSSAVLYKKSLAERVLSPAAPYRARELRAVGNPPPVPPVQQGFFSSCMFVGC